MPQKEHSGQEDSTMSFDREEPQEVAGSDMQTIDDKDRTHVTMEVTMDIRDMEPKEKEAICTLARQYEDSFQEIVSKNRDYGFSFLKTGKELADMPATPIDSVVRTQTYGLLTRIGDKRQRLVENVFGGGDASVSDGPEITARESSNYYQFVSFVLANPQLARELAEN